VEQLLAKIGCIRHYNGSFQDPNQSRASAAFPKSGVANGNLYLNERYYRWRAVAIDSIESPVLPNCTPGQQYLYSTHGYTFVGAALEEVMRKDIQQIVAEELQLPYQLPTLMTMGSFPVAGPSGPVPFYDLAQGYRYNLGTGVSDPVDYEDSSWKVLGGGLQISAVDLARFGWLTLNGDIVGPLTRDNRLWSPLTGGAVDWTPPGATPATTLADTFALAWLIERRNPARLVTGTMVQRRVAEHGGTARGARSILRIYRDDGLIIAILTNQRNTPFGISHPVESMSGGSTDLATRVGTAVFANPPP
jgi:CubicO group peptidase (beta-lactamase class C family)